MRAYAQRPITCAGIVSHAGWDLKRYAIVYGEHPVDWPSFDEGIARALRALPEPAITTQRLGVGFLITHRGAGADYVVLAWWDRENELPLSVVVREQTQGAEWRAARGGESVCVWDLQVIGFERDAYVQTVLGDQHADASRGRDAYLARCLERPASVPARPSVSTA